MEFLLSKLLPLFVYPLGMAILLVLLGVVLGFLGRRRYAWVATILGACVLWWSSTYVVADAVMGALESDYPYQEPALQPVVDAIIILGGFTSIPEGANETIEVSDGVDRLFLGLRLFREGKAPHLVLAGGAPYGSTPESVVMARLYEELGISKEVLLLEKKSRNTRENAVNLREMTEAIGMNRVLLVTSASHMRRAQAVFEKVGFDVVPAPTDYQVAETDPSILDWVPDVEALVKTTKGIKEYIGYFVYWLRGWV
jgi:uncharacterized SAM-binding protein YcdF (DUF218 family)